jgi:hypothetical protein
MGDPPAALAFPQELKFDANIAQFRLVGDALRLDLENRILSMSSPTALAMAIVRMVASISAQVWMAAAIASKTSRHSPYCV